VGDVISGIVFAFFWPSGVLLMLTWWEYVYALLFIFGWRHQVLDTNAKSHFLTRVFIGN